MARPIALQDLVHWNGKDAGTADEVEIDVEGEIQGPGASESDGAIAQDNKRESMYVTLFERMGRIVLNDESHLLSPAEVACLDTYAKLSYGARFLLVRLVLRKHDKLHRLSKLAFESELGPHIPNVIAELCRRQAPDPNVVAKEHNIIGSTSEDGSAIQGAPAPAEPDVTFFAEDESRMTLRELLECLTVNEVCAVAKELKLKIINTRAGLISAIMHYSSTQGTLRLSDILVPSKGKAKDLRPSKQTTLSFHSPKSRPVKDPVRAIVIKILIKCIRVNPDVLKFFRRLNIIFFRDTQLPEKLLTPSLLSCVRKRHYPSYKFSRTADIWKTREDLLKFESALEIEAALQEHLNISERYAGFRRARSTASMLGSENIKMSSTAARATLDSSVSSTETATPSSATVVGKENAPDIPEIATESIRVTEARSVKVIFESVYGLWKEIISCNMCSTNDGEEEENRRRQRGLRRFECGYIYTRIVQRGAEALGILKEYDYELEVLEALLSQRRWKRGSRGAWHDRRALLLMTHLKDGNQAAKRALDAVIEGLQDSDTHIVYRPKLERRLTALEKRLKIAQKDRHVCNGTLVKPGKVLIEGIRVKEAALEPIDRRPERTPCRDLTAYRVPLQAESSEAAKNEKKPTHPISTGKSIWVGRDGEGVSVEIFALQEYESHGFKGFHCESRIVTTIFGLLFWDVLFANVPGALETPWQSAPMDIAEDSFYFARQQLIERRLSEIEAGQGPTILARVDDLHREHETWCVGVRWDLFEKEDLVQIVDCIGSRPLALICRVLAEDYASRTSGVPDLVVWKHDDRKCRFVEVKGPGDTERENQKIWMDVLLRAGVAVEVCRVEERGYAERRKHDKEEKKRRRRASLMKRSARENVQVDGDTKESEVLEHEPLNSSDAGEAQPKDATKRAAELGESTVHTPRFTKRRRQVEVQLISLPPRETS